MRLAIDGFWSMVWFLSILALFQLHCHDAQEAPSVDRVQRPQLVDQLHQRRSQIEHIDRRRSRLSQLLEQLKNHSPRGR